MGRLLSISTVELNRDSGRYRELLLPNKPMQRPALRAGASAVVHSTFPRNT